MSDDRMHHITVRINKDSYIGKKVLETLEDMKRSKGMSFNACIQESILMMNERIHKEPTGQKRDSFPNEERMGEENIFEFSDDSFPTSFD